MADDFETRSEALETQIERLEGSLSGAGEMVAAFDRELVRMRTSLTRTSSSVSSLSNSIGRGLRRAFDGLVFDGLKLSDALNLVGQQIGNSTYSAAINPITSHLGGLIGAGLAGIGAAGFAKGGAFTQGRVTPFARGGVVTGPTTFPMRNGTGLMGEAGPEAILPLERGADGSLGVRAKGGGGGGVTVVMNISTPDAEGFRRSQGQIAAMASRAIARGQRNR
ncbi:MAG: phage tail tape measure protein [Pseudomonadota bacterium]